MRLVSMFVTSVEFDKGKQLGNSTVHKLFTSIKGSRRSQRFDKEKKIQNDQKYKKAKAKMQSSLSEIPKYFMCDG